MSGGPPTRRTAAPEPTPSQPGSKAGASVRKPFNPEVARLLVDAEAFLRLGLVDKAIAHLTGALNRDPSLRDLREPLVKLYVARRRNKSAITELWALLSRCDNPKEEIRFLRYILRLGEKDPAAESRLQQILSQHPAESSGDELMATEAGSIGDELRHFLREHQPPTDLNKTQLVPEVDTRKLMREAELAAETTNPNAAHVEEVAEEMAFQDGSLRRELDEVDTCLTHGRYADALPLLRALSERYPHSKRVQSRLEQLRQARPERGEGPPPAVAPASARKGEYDLHAAQTLPPSSRRRDEAGSRAKRAASQRRLAEIGNSTLEVDPDDIAEEQAAPAQAATARRGPPPPPGPSSLLTNSPESAAARAYKAALGLRGLGQHEQAMALFQTACADPAYSVPGLLMIGLSYRDLDRLHDAVRVLMQAINLPQARDSELSELFYELGATYELLANRAEAILFYQLSLGTAGDYRDANEKISFLQAAILTG